jgi:hypothetical protein
MTTTSRIIVALCAMAALSGCEMLQPTGKMSSYEEPLSTASWQQRGVLLRFTPPKSYQTTDNGDRSDLLEDER